MKAKPAPQGESPRCVHATGHMIGLAPGIMEGTVEFPVRGAKQFRMERLPPDRVGECAKLTCLFPHSEAVLVLIQEIDDRDHFWGVIKVEGYAFGVRVETIGRQRTITFLDVKQPVWCDEALALMAAAE